MPAKKERKRRRSPGEGSVWAYRTKSGAERWAIGYTRVMPDGITRKSVTRRTGPNGETWTNRQAAQDALREALVAVKKGELVDPSKQLVGAYLEEWLDGLRDLAPSTIASYRKNVRLHVIPYIGAIPLNLLRTAQLNTMYRQLERSGRRDHKGDPAGGGLSARTTRYIHTIVHKALKDAVISSQLPRNPADERQGAKPPGVKDAESPEMHCWSAEQLGTFLAWSAEHSDMHALWVTLACTGMRRGEALGLRWSDISFERSTISIQRSAGLVRVKGQPGEKVEGRTKSRKPRTPDIDPATVAVLRAYKKERGSMALQLARDDARVFGDIEGRAPNPEHVSRKFKADLARCRKALGDAAPPECRLHDLRHTHASALLLAGVPVHVVSRRLGHANPTITLTVYAHCLPSSQRDAADLFGGATS